MKQLCTWGPAFPHYLPSLSQHLRHPLEPRAEGLSRTQHRLKSAPTPATHKPKNETSLCLKLSLYVGKTARQKDTRDCSPCCGAETADLGASRAPLKLVQVWGESWGDTRGLVSFIPKQLGSAARGVMGSIPPKKGSPHQITPKLLPGLGPGPSPAVSQKMPMIQTVWGQVP